jgi:protein Mpv17
MNTSTAALASFARFYNSNFDRRPVPTLMVTNGILNTIADLLVSHHTPPTRGNGR